MADTLPSQLCPCVGGHRVCPSVPVPGPLSGWEALRLGCSFGARLSGTMLLMGLCSCVLTGIGVCEFFCVFVVRSLPTLASASISLIVWVFHTSTMRRYRRWCTAELVLGVFRHSIAPHGIWPTASYRAWIGWCPVDVLLTLPKVRQTPRLDREAPNVLSVCKRGWWAMWLGHVACLCATAGSVRASDGHRREV